MSNLSIISANPEDRVKALQSSRLKDLIKEKELFPRICEAAVHLLNSDDLRACSEDSIMGALYKAASLGFRLEPEFGECYLVPRTVKGVKVCVFQIGYKGWKATALQTGHVAFIEAREVYKEDHFFFKYGTNATIEHTPADENSSVTTHFYARAVLRGGGEIFEVINKQAAEKSRRFSEGQYTKHGQYPNQTKVFSEKPIGFWEKGYAAMALRGPIKKLCAMLPLTPAIEAATIADGGITYLQKDGTVTTISPVDVENNADQIEEAGVSKDLAPRYGDMKDNLIGLLDFNSVLEFYKQFKESDLSKDRNFAELIYKRAAELAKTVDNLTEFYNEAIYWKGDKELTKILTAAKSKIENAK